MTVNKCRKPDCHCADIAIMKNGGEDVKEYPCLATTDSNRIKSPLPDEQADAIPADLEQRAKEYADSQGVIEGDDYLSLTSSSLRAGLKAAYLAGAQSVGGGKDRLTALQLINKGFGSPSLFTEEEVNRLQFSGAKVLELMIKYAQQQSHPSASIVDQLRKANPYTTDDIDSEIGWDNCCDKLESILKEQGGEEKDVTCVFCEMPCEPAPTKRGWSSVRYGKGLHFDCAGKVVDQGNIIGMKELEDLGKDPTT